jgi:cytidylate kinase
MEALSADDQQPFDELIRCEEEKVLRQLSKQHDMEEEEVLQQLKERHIKAKKKYLSYFTVDCHSKIIHQGEIDMASLLLSLQAPIVSILDPSFKAFVD